MNQCIFHIGMPKTGTTSIQESLYYGLKDPAFRYAGLGQRQMNACRAIHTLFCDAPENWFYYRQLGASAKQVHRDRLGLQQQFEDVLGKATALGQTLILSAERGWRMTPEEFQRFRQFMEARHYSVKVIAYLRPWKPWLESHFQQIVKLGFGDFPIVPKNLTVLNYRDRIQTLEAIFGTDQVEVIKYDSMNFPNGCVVQDFCQRLGITFDPTQVRRANDSLSLPAIQLLYSYRKLGPGFEVGRWAVLSNNLLAYIALAELTGPPVRFHSSLVEPLLKELALQRPWLEKRLGDSWDENFYKDDDLIGIRQESDLFSYDRESLEWLAAATGNRPSHDPQEVAAQMHYLRYHPTVKSLISAGKQKLVHLAGLIA